MCAMPTSYNPKPNNGYGQTRVQYKLKNKISFLLKKLQSETAQTWFMH